MLLYRLLKPLDYLRIYHSQKRKYDFLLPMIIATLTTIALYMLPSSVKITGNDGLLAIFTGLLQILTGFYIASLAAVSTFEREGMDQVMLGDPPTLRKSEQGRVEIEQLTRRRFLSLMFGYLSLLSFFLYFLGAFADLLDPNLHALIPAVVFPVFKWCSLFIYLFFSSNLMVATLLGLYYMTEKIHKETGKVISKSDKPK